MKKAPNKPKAKGSLLKKDVRLKYTRNKVKDLADAYMESGRYSRLGAFKAAIKELKIDEMQEEYLRSLPDFPD